MARQRVKRTDCPNCGRSLLAADNYCPSCGQENHTHKLPVRHFIVELLSGLFNFDTKLRRQSLARDDLFHGHVGGMDVLALSLLVAEQLLHDGGIEAARGERYRQWDEGLGSEILGGALSLTDLEKRVSDGDIDPAPVSGRQERLENLVNRALWRAIG